MWRPFCAEWRDRVFVSVFSIGEIRKGIEALAAGKRRSALEYWLDNEIRPWLAQRLLPVTVAIAERWGVLSAQTKAAGRPRPVIDSVLAATSLEHDLVFVTRNVRDYEGLGLTLVNPWDSLRR